MSPVVDSAGPLAADPSAGPVRIACYVSEFPADNPDSAARYAQVVRSSFDFDIPEHALARPFSARSEVFFLPDLTVSCTVSTASRFTRTARTVATQGTDQILVVIYRNGHFELTTDGRTRRVEPGEIAFIDLSRPVLVDAPTVDNISFAVSRRALGDVVPFLDAVHGFVRPPDALSRLLRGLMEDIVANSAEMTVVEARGVSGAAIQLVAACLEPLSRQYVEAGRNVVSLVPIKAYIDKHLADPTLGPQTLLEQFGITRSTLYRLFEPLGGVRGYIAQRRLIEAFRRLSDTRYRRERISKLAADLGFSHPSAFTRAFKETFGHAPTEVQAMAENAREQDIPLVTSLEPLQFFRPLGSA